MSAVAIAVQILLADTKVKSAVGTSVFPVVAPQQAGLPRIVVSTIHEAQDYVLAGPRRGYDSRVEIACFADTAKAADQLGEMVKDAMAAAVHLDVVLDDDVSPNISYEVTAWKEGTDLLDYDESRSVYRRLFDYRMRWI